MELSGAATFVLAVCLCYLFFLSLWKKKGSLGQLPPGPTPLPLLGNLLQVSSSQTMKSLEKLRERYGPVFTVYFGTKPVVMLCGHEVVKEALVDQAEAFSGRAQMATLDRTFQSHGVVFANGERWKQLRRFSLTVLRNFGMGKKSIEERIQEEAQFLLQELRNTREQPFDPTYFLSRAVSNVICSVVFGNRFDYQDKDFLALLQMMNESFREMSTPWSQFYDMNESLLKYLPGPHKKVYHILEKMRQFIAKRAQRNMETFDPSFPRDFIDCFLIQMEKEKDNPSSEFNVKNLELTTLNLFFAGTETVSSTLRFGFLLLMKHPEVQEKMHEEIGRVIGHDRVPNIEDRGRMPYTDAVIHEVQRISDLLPMNVPHTVTRDTLFRGYVLPKDTEVYPLLSTVLHDPAMYKDPQSFNPENFLDASGRFKKNDAFMPFSSGKRICLGEALARMELFLFFTTILQSFRLQPLVPPAELNTTALGSGFTNLPPFYQLRVVPR
ncbi:cytochrome P450 2G1-like [Struthio camelus]|uniref:Cytochrome P450 2G19 n=1 Tax=Struthio camelus TaxID=8801 RepID=U6BY20_STRCA|nr:cytochrome P450 2G19 [Struthio camelus]